MHRVCRVILWVFLAAYLAALALLAIGTFGLFGQERDPLSAVFLIPLGLPWNQFLPDGIPDTLRPWLAIGAPAVNIGLLGFVCRPFRRHD